MLDPKVTARNIHFAQKDDDSDILVTTEFHDSGKLVVGDDYIPPA